MTQWATARCVLHVVLSRSFVHTELISPLDEQVDALDTSGDGQVDTVLVDLYRDTPLRYMGYSNEVGEAFRPIVPRLVVPSYALAIAYVLADTADKARRARDLSVAASGSADTRRVLEQAGDCLVWQLLASVFVPGAVIHQVVHVFGRFIKTVPTLPPISTCCQSSADMRGKQLASLIQHTVFVNNCFLLYAYEICYIVNGQNQRSTIDFLRN